MPPSSIPVHQVTSYTCNTWSSFISGVEDELSLYKIEATRLLNMSVSENTRKSYDGSMLAFKQFCSNLEMPFLPSTTEAIALYISKLSLDGKSHNSIDTYLSAISFFHKLYGHQDPTATFIIAKMREGCRRDRPRKDTRLPITPFVLTKVMGALPLVTESKYEFAVFRAMYLLAYAAFMRVSEITVPSKTLPYSQERTLMFEDLLHLSATKCNLRLKVTKTNQVGQPISLQLSSLAMQNPLCPVSALRTYINVRPSGVMGPLFIHLDHSPVTRYQFSSVLSKALRHCNIPEFDRYKSHGFRIGACSAASMAEIPQSEIKTFGRWSQRSTAYKRYIRIPTHKLFPH